ncbi:hypothetical protein ANFP_31490 [Acidithiobacillus ferrooxidans]|jgi:hypothetical protein|nr:hypothetical protein ANFP_31490 [Acidithiobacillus ferrooxidans]
MDQGGVHHPAFGEQQAFLPQDDLYFLEDRARQVVPLQQTTKFQDGRFIGNKVPAKIDTHESPQQRDLVEGFFHARIRVGIPLGTSKNRRSERRII